MFRGLGDAERRILLILRPGISLTVSDARREYPEFDYRVHRQAMQSLCRKGFVQRAPGPVFKIGVRFAPAPPQPRAPGFSAPSLRAPSNPELPRSPIRQASPVEALDGASGVARLRLETPRRLAPAPPQPIRQAPAPRQAVSQAPAPPVFLSAADAYATRVARDVERQKEAMTKTRCTTV
jgi:hypothetical protein